MSDFHATYLPFIAPRRRDPPDEWAAQHVHIIDSAIGAARFAPEMAPWWIDPMREIVDNGNRLVQICAPVGTGKSTMFEALINYIVSEDPGGCLVTAQTDPDARDWMESRLTPSLRKNEHIKGLWPKDTNKIRKDAIIFPHMPLFVGGPSLSNLQSKSIRWVLCDEVWRWQPGRIAQAKRRTHDRWNSRIVLVSQGGAAEGSAWSTDVGNPDFDAEWNLTDQRILHWKCPKCSAENPWRWEDIKYEAGEDLAEDRDWFAVADSARCECPACAASFADTPADRRALAFSSFYRATNSKGIPGHVGFWYPGVAVWWISWGKLVVEWVKANDAKRQGDLNPLRLFLQQRLAQPWTEEDLGDGLRIVPGTYRKSDYEGGALLNDEVGRILSVDVQHVPFRHFWAVIRAYRTDGTSRLIWEGKVETWQMLEELQREYKVGERLVFVDGQFETEEVYEQCALNGRNWVVLHGSGKMAFTANVRGRRVARVYSPMQVRVTRGRAINYLHWAVGPVKDVLARKRSGDAAGWEIPEDVSTTYRRQITGEIKKDVRDKDKNMMVRRWVKIRANHLWDCEAMNLLAAMALGFVGEIIVGSENEGEETA